MDALQGRFSPLLSLAVILCFAFLAGCGGEPPTSTTVPDSDAFRTSAAVKAGVDYRCVTYCLELTDVQMALLEHVPLTEIGTEAYREEFLAILTPGQRAGYGNMVDAYRTGQVARMDESVQNFIRMVEDIKD